MAGKRSTGRRATWKWQLAQQGHPLGTGLLIAGLVALGWFVERIEGQPALSIIDGCFRLAMSAMAKD